jgi:hypothetical protein
VYWSYRQAAPAFWDREVRRRRARNHARAQCRTRAKHRKAVVQVLFAAILKVQDKTAGSRTGQR